MQARWPHVCGLRVTAATSATLATATLHVFLATTTTANARCKIHARGL